MRLAILAVCSGCTALQSAHTVAPGSSEVSVGVGRTSQFNKNIDEGEWTGHVMLRVGVVDGFDFGLHVEHTPGTGGVGAFAIDPKVRVGRNGRATFSIGLPAGALWTEDDEVELLGQFLLPSMYLTTQISPYVDFVSSVHYVVARIKSDDFFDRYDVLTGYGASFGPRFTDEDRTYFAQPELGMLRVEETTYLTFGLTIAVGN